MKKDILIVVKIIAKTAVVLLFAAALVRIILM